jgi:hypothetical protein
LHIDNYIENKKTNNKNNIKTRNEDYNVVDNKHNDFQDIQYENLFYSSSSSSSSSSNYPPHSQIEQCYLQIESLQTQIKALESMFELQERTIVSKLKINEMKENYELQKINKNDIELMNSIPQSLLSDNTINTINKNDNNNKCTTKINDEKSLNYDEIKCFPFLKLLQTWRKKVFTCIVQKMQSEQELLRQNKKANKERNAMKQELNNVNTEIGIMTHRYEGQLEKFSNIGKRVYELEQLLYMEKQNRLSWN